MANKAIFLDRDHTLIEDPGYLSDPEAVKLLPGVELAMKSLAQAGYKLVVVTNQSAIARGLLTEESLGKVHARMRKLLSDHGAHLDAIYYCPYHPEGTVEEYAVESDLRKPKPGMLLEAAKELDIDLSQSWMVGDSGRDIEAGQRAGCRTVRIRVRGAGDQNGSEGVQADATVRNLLDAARVILREPARAVVASSGLQEALEHPQPATEPDLPAPADADVVLREVLRHVRELASWRSTAPEPFSVLRMLAGVAQVLVGLSLVVALVQLTREHVQVAIVWAVVAVGLQGMALTLLLSWRGPRRR